jgi:CheY-like chemotaxis protein
MGEPLRLQQIAWNLISNAIKFTESGGSVRVVTERDDSSARLTVEDTGVGIAADFLPHVFDRFRQADGSTSRVHGGLGLGLAIANALAKMHGGRLEVKSDGVGHGSQFTLTIGIARQVAVAVEPVNEQSHSLLGLDVLIVEDSPDTLALLSTIFTNEGANVTAVSSATDALDAAANKKPNLIISDIGMPGTDGYQFLEELRSLPEMSQIPAIAISGYAGQEDRQRALKAGYAALVAKPIDVEGLFELIQDLRLGAMSSSNQ